MSRGRFIVVEGIDGSGSTSQARRLVATLQAHGVGAVFTHEPTPGPIGRLLRDVLEGRTRLPTPSAYGTPAESPLAWRSLALLFAADRVDHVAGLIEPALSSGQWIVSDRYVLSSLAYQALTSGEGRAAVPWLRQVNSAALVPDLTLVLHVEANVAAERRRSRGGPAELFEYDALQRVLVQWYRDAAELLGPEQTVIGVDGHASETQCAQRIWEHVRQLCV